MRNKYLKLYYPEHGVWEYSLYLGSANIDGTDYDLGIYVDSVAVSAAIVYGPDPSHYISGELSVRRTSPPVLELIRRGKALGIIKEGSDGDIIYCRDCNEQSHTCPGCGCEWW